MVDEGPPGVKRFRAYASAAVILLMAAAGASATASVPIGVRTVVITIRHSQFSVSKLDVKPGERVRFVVHNTDPIDHELIVGALPVQLRHESGREAHHRAKPGEVSVPLFETATTPYTFGEAGTVLFGCHLPGHWDYGMQGRITVG